MALTMRKRWSRGEYRWKFADLGLMIMKGHDSCQDNCQDGGPGGCSDFDQRPAAAVGGVLVSDYWSVLRMTSRRKLRYWRSHLKKRNPADSARARMKNCNADLGSIHLG